MIQLLLFAICTIYLNDFIKYPIYQYVSIDEKNKLNKFGDIIIATNVKNIKHKFINAKIQYLTNNNWHQVLANSHYVYIDHIDDRLITSQWLS